MLYFAYGSNMNPSQMKERCPGSQFLTIAKLQGYTFAFTRFSQTRKCGVMDLVEKKDAHVWGVVYKISEEDLQNLDRMEISSRTDSYYRREEVVWEKGEEEKCLPVHLYEVRNKKKNIPPNQHYKDLILEGARHWGLPSEYIKILEEIAVE